MTDQETLARLIGEEGFETVYPRGAIYPMRYPLPIPELIEIAEARWKDDEGNSVVTDSSSAVTSAQWWRDSCVGKHLFESAIKSNKQEARMACAIKAMERIQQEKEKE